MWAGRRLCPQAGQSQPGFVCLKVPAVVAIPLLFCPCCFLPQSPSPPPPIIPSFTLYYPARLHLQSRLTDQLDIMSGLFGNNPESVQISMGKPDKLPKPEARVVRTGIFGQEVKCDGCGKSPDWLTRHSILDDYNASPCHTMFNHWAWDGMRGVVHGFAGHVQRLGLAPWDDLRTSTQDRLNKWSPVARRLWESDFRGHPRALVRAWIWHYLDDNFFSFSPDANADDLTNCSSKAWEYVRGLRRELQGQCCPVTHFLCFQ
jgi:hypothetical protein